jgi:hypothetical protein
MKKILLIFGALIATGAPMVTAISCTKASASDVGVDPSATLFLYSEDGTIKKYTTGTMLKTLDDKDPLQQNKRLIGGVEENLIQFLYDQEQK